MFFADLDFGPHALGQHCRKPDTLTILRQGRDGQFRDAALGGAARRVRDAGPLSARQRVDCIQWTGRVDRVSRRRDDDRDRLGQRCAHPRSVPGRRGARVVRGAGRRRPIALGIPA